MEEKEQKEFREERFEFAFFINDNLIAKRNFRINKFIPESMNSIEFKETVDEIVEMVNRDLQSKSRVYEWVFFDEEDPENEFLQPLIEPWECTFKFVVFDNKIPVIEKIWDGRGYPKSVREKVDLTNKIVKITDKLGRTWTYDKESFFEERGDRLTPELYVLKAQIMEKPDLLMAITHRICEVCSPRENMFQTTSDYTLSETWETADFVRNEDGSLRLNKDGQAVIKEQGPRKKYSYSISQSNNKLFADWGATVASKTKEYFKNLF